MSEIKEYTLMATSAAITEIILNSATPEATKQEIWMQTRYLIAQRPSVAEVDFTGDGWYEGKTVIPAPKAKVGAKQFTTDLKVLEQQQYIRFIDSNVTDGADNEIKEALFRPMTNAEADAYEKQLKALLASD
jgi:hypothetical protein